MTSRIADCGQRGRTTAVERGVGTHLDELLDEMLRAGAEIATRRNDQQGAVPAA